MRTSFSRSFRLTVLAFAALAVALFSSGAQAATRTVTITSNRFTDASSGNSTTTIQAGDSVNWVWGSGVHSTTSGTCTAGCAPDGKWDSGERSSGTFPRAFNTAGTFTYFCSVHLSMMQGTIVVQAATAAPTANFTFSPSGVPVMGTPIQFTDTSTGSPTSWAWNFGDPASGTSNVSALQNPTHVFQSAGTYTVSLQASNAGGPNTATSSITISAGGAVACVPDSETLCLNNGRFAVTAEWTKPDLTTGHGTPVKLTNDSGYFWFFDASNIEVVTKVLNACGLNNAYWVFAAGLTNVQVQLRVVDTDTGAVYAKENPQGTAFVPIQDTGAFPASCP
jgi:PKD repeat protein